jgi:hypothetical protein
MVLLTLVKVAFALVPRAVMAIRHTTMISDNITAYSTAVGPSSSLKKSSMLCMAFLPFEAGDDVQLAWGNPKWRDRETSKRNARLAVCHSFVAIIE